MLYFALAVLIVGASSTPQSFWGKNPSFPMYIPSSPDMRLKLDYVIKPTVISISRRNCRTKVSTVCPAEVVAAIDVMSALEGQISLLQLLDRFVLTQHLRECLRTNIARLLRELYISEDMLNWLVDLNSIGEPEITRSVFKRLFHRTPSKKTRLPLRPEANRFRMGYCATHHWYSEILMRYQGKPISAMSLSTLPANIISVKDEMKDTIIAPSTSDVLRILVMERRRMVEEMALRARFAAPKEGLKSLERFTPEGDPLDAIDTDYGFFGVLLPGEALSYAGDDEDFHDYVFDEI